MRGIGPKTIKILYEKLKITSISELEKAAFEGRIAKLKNWKNLLVKALLMLIIRTK